MKRGIDRYGPVKSFLIKGIFKPIFRPILYKQEDYIHHEFIMVFEPIVKNLNRKKKANLFISYWTFLVPKQLFEILFLPDDKGDYILLAVKDSDHRNGKICAYYTQAFVLWYLEQFLKNDPNYQDRVGVSIRDIENTLAMLYGEHNLIKVYLDHFRNEFNTGEWKVDPLDWGIVYVHNIFDLLFNDKQLMRKSLQQWDNDHYQKFVFIHALIDFFKGSKESSLELISH